MVRRILGLLPRKARPSWQAWVATRAGVTVRYAATRAELFYWLERAIQRPDVLWTCGVDLDPPEGIARTVCRRARQSLTYLPVEWADGRAVLAQLEGKRVTVVTYDRHGRAEYTVTLTGTDNLYNSLSDGSAYQVVAFPQDALDTAVCLFRLAHTRTLVGAVVPRSQLRAGICPRPA